MKRILFALVIVIIPAFAITDVGGVIATNTVWGPTGNPPDTVYNLVDDIFVLDTVTLTIQPGVRILASNLFCIQIYGRIIACGTPQDSITFTSSQPTPSAGDWHGIWFVTPNADSSRLEHCIIEYAQYGTFLGAGVRLFVLGSPGLIVSPSPFPRFSVQGGQAFVCSFPNRSCYKGLRLLRWVVN